MNIKMMYCLTCYSSFPKGHTHICVKPKPSKPKQPGTRYRARHDPEHDGLWGVVDRKHLKFDWDTGINEYPDNISASYVRYAGYGWVVSHFPTITDAISFIELLELSDEINKEIEK